jgi:Ni2+-binding GTPase involved in maturation of urease and hydrogenase
MARARYIMVGGFLGAGKTTAIQALAERLDRRGLRVGLITNDQGVGLVDTVLGRAKRFPVEEIAGGCFCCRFGSLIDAADQLTEATRPDVFLAEPVGSCTDLVATVSLPLQQIYGASYEVSPLSVLVDPLRAARVLSLEEGKRLSRNVCYIYEKQLEEAEILVINKADLLDEGSLARLCGALGSTFPQAKVLVMSARDGEGVEAWLEEVMGRESQPGSVMSVDYKRYGEGEALLGWLNATIGLVGVVGEGEEFDGNLLLEELAGELGGLLEARGIEVAHLKMTLVDVIDPYEVASVNLVGSGRLPYLSHRLSDAIEGGEISLNLRAEGDPAELEAIVWEGVERVFGGSVEWDKRHLESFRPGQPVPVHRVSGV